MEIGVNAGRLGEGSERDSWQRLMKTDIYDMVRSHMTIIPFPQKCIRPELIDRVVLVWLFMNLIIHRHRPQHWDDLTRSFHLQSRPRGKWPILDWHIHEWHMDRQDESRQGQQGTTQSKVELLGEEAKKVLERFARVSRRPPSSKNSYITVFIFLVFSDLEIVIPGLYVEIPMWSDKNKNFLIGFIPG